MIRVIGFAMFFIAVGIIIMLFLPNKWCGAIIAIGLLIIGFNLFCCKKRDKC